MAAEKRKHFTLIMPNGSERIIVADEMIPDGVWMNFIRIDQPAEDSLAALPSRILVAVVKDVSLIIPSDV